MNIISDKVVNDGVCLKKFVEERRLLKTKVKLLHILMLDDDLRLLNKLGMGLSFIDLGDLFLVDNNLLVAPIKDRIIAYKDNDVKLKVWLIYLSYLYNFDFLNVYQNDVNLLCSLILKLQISDNIKDNLFKLLTINKGEYFSSYINELGSDSYREGLRLDSLMLQRCVNL